MRKPVCSRLSSLARIAPPAAALAKHLKKSYTTDAFMLNVVVRKVPNCHFQLDIEKVTTSDIGERVFGGPDGVLRGGLDLSGKAAIAPEKNGFSMNTWPFSHCRRLPAKKVY